MTENSLGGESVLLAAFSAEKEGTVSESLITKSYTDCHGAHKMSDEYVNFIVQKI